MCGTDVEVVTRSWLRRLGHQRNCLVQKSEIALHTKSPRCLKNLNNNPKAFGNHFGERENRLSPTRRVPSPPTVWHRFGPCLAPWPQCALLPCCASSFCAGRLGSRDILNYGSPNSSQNILCKVSGVIIFEATRPSNHNVEPNRIFGRPALRTILEGDVWPWPHQLHWPQPWPQPLTWPLPWPLPLSPPGPGPTLEAKGRLVRVDAPEALRASTRKCLFLAQAPVMSWRGHGPGPVLARPCREGGMGGGLGARGGGSGNPCPWGWRGKGLAGWVGGRGVFIYCILKYLFVYLLWVSIYVGVSYWPQCEGPYLPLWTRSFL